LFGVSRKVEVVTKVRPEIYLLYSCKAVVRQEMSSAMFHQNDRSKPSELQCFEEAQLGLQSRARITGHESLLPPVRYAA